MAGLGFVTAGASLGVSSVMVRPQRGLFPQKGNPQFEPIVAQAIVEEISHDKLEIVEHPVEQGSKISDHAFKHPAEVRVQYMWSNTQDSSGLFAGVGAAVSATQNIPQSLLSGNSQSQAKAVYQQLLKLQANRVIFSLFTGKRNYDDMMIESLSQDTSSKTENSLSVTMDCKQINIVTTRVANSVPSADQANPQATLSPESIGESVLAAAPALSNAINTVTAAANSSVSGLTDALTQTSTELQSAVSSAIPALEASVVSATQKLPGVMTDFQNTLTEVSNSFRGAIAGASGELPGIVSNGVASLQEALAGIGTPFEIPLAPFPQSFTINLGAQ